MFLFTMALAAAFVHAQKIQQKNVPASVQKGFQKQFPNNKEVKWEKEKENYEAGFKLNGTKTSAIFNISGTLLETETAISQNALSAPAKAYVAKHYPNQKIKEAAKITNAKGEVTYEAEIKGKDLIFDNNGQFLKGIKD